MSILRCLAVLLLTWAVAVQASMDDGLGAELKAAETQYREQGPEPTLSLFEALRQRAAEAGDRAAEATAERFVGECHWLMGDFELARAHLDRAVELARAQGDRLLEAKSLNVLGLLAWDLGDYDAAMARFRAASAIGADLGDAKVQGATLNNLSLVLDELGDYRQSLANYEQVLDIYAGADFPRGEGDTLGNIGGVHLLLGRYEDAITHYERALAISEALDSAIAMSQDHGNLGFAWSGLGQTDRALAHFDRALELAEKAGLAQERGYWLRGKANVEIDAGRYDQGLVHHRAALAAFEESGAEGLALDARHDLGRLLLALGDPVSARAQFEQALAQAEAMGRQRAVTLNQLALGDLEARQERAAEAEALYRAAFERADAAGEGDLAAAAELSLGRLALDRDRPEQAQAAAARALGALADQPSPPLEAAALLLRADALRAGREHEAALESYGDARAVAATLGDPELLWQIDFGRGLALERLGRTEAAADALAASVASIESVRDRLVEQRFRAGYLQDKHQVYTRLVRLQLELGRDEEAFGTAERLRRYSFRQQSPWPALAAREDPRLVEARARIDRLQRALREEREEPPAQQRERAIDTFSAELVSAERRYQALLDDLAATGPVDGEAIAAAEARSRLRAGEALLEYVVGDESLMLFLLTREAMRTASIPLDRASLHSRVELLRDLLLERDSDRWSRPAAALAKQLLAPALAEGWLDGMQRLYLVPHGVLNYLPFAVLVVGEEGDTRALIEEFDLAYLPTAAALRAPGPAAVGFAPVLTVAPARARLRHAPEEAEAIARLFRPEARTLRGADATESAFRGLAGDYGVLHLATHGYFNKLNPLLSGLELEADDANDGLLEVHEILQLRLAAELVTLSACKTGLGSGFFNEIPAGDDFVGLTRAFLQAGSRAVLATLWEVDDRSTVDLMTGFYERLGKAGAADKAGALARAQRALRTTERYRHPYYWAPFVLVGDTGTAPPRITRS